MKMRSYLPILFALVVILQVYVPASMVFQNERVYLSGTTFKMQLAPIDPEDPFRGKYIILSFRENTGSISKQSNIQPGNTVYVVMKPGKNEFLKIESITPEFKKVDAPAVCIAAHVRSVIETNGDPMIELDYPFSRFYMEESKAAETEQRYLRAAADTNSLSYASIKVYNGNVVVKDIYINGQAL